MKGRQFVTGRVFGVDPGTSMGGFGGMQGQTRKRWERGEKEREGERHWERRSE